MKNVAYFIHVSSAEPMTGKIKAIVEAARNHQSACVATHNTHQNRIMQTACSGERNKASSAPIIEHIS